MTMSNPYFSFKQFNIKQDRCAMKVGTDGVLLGAWAEGGRRILDIGTGTGLVALMMAQRYADAEVTGIEIDDEAAAQAKENATSSPFTERVCIHNVSLQDFNAGTTYDAITCNPPFYDNSLLCPDDCRTTARHTTSLSYHTLIEHCADLLSDDGTLSIILPAEYLSKIESECAYASLFIRNKLFIRTTEKKAPKRVMLAIGKRRTDNTTCETAILTKDGKRSEWYAQLTNDFYTK